MRKTRWTLSLVLGVLGLGAGPAHAITATFTATGGEQRFTVPAGVTRVQATVVGAGGLANAPGVTSSRAASISGVLAVKPGQLLFVEVGTSSQSGPGFNGGGSPRGGGGSDVRTASGASGLGSRLIVAAGGGGKGLAGTDGGDAGATAAGPTGGGGAGATGGAAGGGGGLPGQLGLGGAGGGGGGGGGGGAFGGGGGGASNGTGGGGGGGSSLVPAGGSLALAPLGTAARVSLTYQPLPAGGTGTGGGTGGGGGGTVKDRVKPRLSAFAVTPTRFTAANTGPALVAAVGGRVFYRLSEDASITFSVQRATKGRRSGGKCKRKTRRNAKRKRCTRYVKVRGRLRHQGKAGVNTFRFMGRLRNRALPKGSYRLTAKATDPGRNVSRPKSAAFKVVR